MKCVNVEITYIYNNDEHKVSFNLNIDGFDIETIDNPYSFRPLRCMNFKIGYYGQEPDFIDFLLDPDIICRSFDFKQDDVTLIELGVVWEYHARKPHDIPIDEIALIDIEIKYKDKYNRKSKYNRKANKMKSVSINDIQKAALKFPEVDSELGRIIWNQKKALKSINCHWLWNEIENGNFKFEKEWLTPCEIELATLKSIKAPYKCSISNIIIKDKEMEVNLTDWIIFDDGKFKVKEYCDVSHDDEIYHEWYGLYSDEEYRDYIRLKPLYNKDFQNLLKKHGVDIANEDVRKFDLELAREREVAELKDNAMNKDNYLD